AHAAGDMYGNTYINSYTGGIFNLFDVNAVKHIALEGYVAERTPDLPASVYSAVNSKGVGDGVDAFITQHANPYVYGVNPGDSKKQSFPYLFSSLRAWVQGKIDWYDRKISDFNHDINAEMAKAEQHRHAGDHCGIFDFSCSKVWEYAQAAAHVVAA